jgi:hypothetical protein
MNQTRIAAAAALLMAIASPLTAQRQGDFRWSGRLSNGQEIQIRNLNGDVRAEPSSGSEVEVVGHRRGDDVDEVEIRVVRQGDGMLICAVFPNSGGSWSGRNRSDDNDGDRRGGDECSNRGRRSSTRNFDARVDFVVRVPAGVRLAAATVSGNVSARGLRSEVHASSVSGDVEVSTTGPAEASSVSGDVIATLGRVGGDDLSFRSVSGNVILRLPAGIDADFEARTVSGDIDSAFPVSSVGRDRGRGWVNVRIGEHVRGTFGRGGPDISVETVSGNVTVERSR